MPDIKQILLEGLIAASNIHPLREVNPVIISPYDLTDDIQGVPLIICPMLYNLKEMQWFLGGGVSNEQALAFDGKVRELLGIKNSAEG
jgi:hypothetical protein